MFVTSFFLLYQLNVFSTIKSKVQNKCRLYFTVCNCSITMLCREIWHPTHDVRDRRFK